MSGAFTEGSLLCDESRAQVKELEGTYKKLISKFDPIFDSFSAISSGISDVQSGLKAGKTASKTLKPLVDNLYVPPQARIIKEVSVLALGISAKLFGAIEKTVKAVSKRMKPLLKMVAEVQSIMNKPFDLFDPVYQTITHIQRVCNALIPNEPKIMADPNYTDEVSALRAFWDKIRNFIKAILSRLINYIKSIIKRLEHIADKLTEAVKKLKEMMPGFKTLKGILEGLNKHVQTIKDMMGPALKTIQEKVAAAKEVASDLLDWFESLPGVGDLVAATRAAANSALEAFDRLKKAFEEKISKAISNLKAFDVINVPIKNLKQLLDGFIEAINERVVSAVNQGLSLLKGIQDTFTGSFEILKKFKLNKPIVERLLRKALNALLEAAEDLIDTAPAGKLEKLKRAKDAAKGVSGLLKHESHNLASEPVWRSRLAVRAIRLEARISSSAAELDDERWQMWSRHIVASVHRLIEEADYDLPLQGPPEFGPSYFKKLDAVYDNAQEAFMEADEEVSFITEATKFPWFETETNLYLAPYESLPEIVAENDNLPELYETFLQSENHLSHTLEQAEMKFSELIALRQ